MKDSWLSSHGKCGGHGGPQADEGGERKLKRINRELKEMGPQADGGGEQGLINDERLLIGDDWWLIVDCLHTEKGEETDNSRIWQSEFIEPT